MKKKWIILMSIVLSLVIVFFVVVAFCGNKPAIEAENIKDITVSFDYEREPIVFVEREEIDMLVGKLIDAVNSGKRRIGESRDGFGAILEIQYRDDARLKIIVFEDDFLIDNSMYRCDKKYLDSIYEMLNNN